MTKDEKAEDYDRLSYEYTQLNQELKSQKRANKKLKEQLLLHNVVKPFYCYENLANGKEKCSNECIDCVGIKPVQ